jgi:hypothetical protein
MFIVNDMKAANPNAGANLILIAQACDPPSRRRSIFRHQRG